MSCMLRSSPRRAERASSKGRGRRAQAGQLSVPAGVPLSMAPQYRQMGRGTRSSPARQSGQRLCSADSWQSSQMVG